MFLSEAGVQIMQSKNDLIIPKLRKDRHNKPKCDRLARDLPNRTLQDTVSTNPQFGCRCNQTAATAAELNRYAPLQLRNPGLHLGATG